MEFKRHFSKPNLNVYNQVKWKRAESKIVAANGQVIFHMEDIEVPEAWTQNPINILAQKYFRKAGVPSRTIMRDGKDFESKLPNWLIPHQPDTENLDFVLGPETSAHQVFHRIAGAWTYWGWKMGIFTNGFPLNIEKSNLAQIFYDELYLILAKQIAAPNSPQWFNTGLFWAYGIEGSPSGQWAIDHGTNEPYETRNAYERPQPHACFIQPVSDDLVNPGGIMDLWQREVRLFKQGSGTGSNFSNIRGKGEKLSGGGVSSGLLSFLRIGDEAAGAIASGGTTRRSAKMVCLDLDHPEIEDFIDWKMNEELKAAQLYVGGEVINRHLGGGTFVDDLTPQAIIDRVANNISTPVCDLGFEGEAMKTVSGQNANNSVRPTESFFRAVEGDLEWALIARTTGKVVKKLKARDLWNKICTAAWASADPGLLYHDTINDWHTCREDGRINACNPCGEYQFLDNTACNLASLNLYKFLNKDKSFDVKSFTHATRLLTIVLDISVEMASFPSREIAVNSQAYRTLGLGYSNLGGILMRLGIGYDSDKGRRLAADITALMTGVAYQTSAEMAEELGAFSAWERNSIPMRRVLENHERCMGFKEKDELNHWLISPYVPNCAHYLDGNIISAAKKAWEKVSQANSFRNAQVTLLAPTGTIGLLMDCDTLGVEPDFSLKKFKYLSGGGMMQIVNECIPDALQALGYTQSQITSIKQHVEETGTLEGWKVNGHEIPEEHLSVFDCSVESGNGSRALHPMSHVLMVAAVQPFLSGAVSKTTNMPGNSTIQDVDEIYKRARDLGVKAIALYRDGSKLTQPLNSRKEISKGPPLATFQLSTSNSQIPAETRPRNLDPKFARFPLPMKRKGYTQKVKIDGQSIYLRTGDYPDSTLGEIFVNWSREGSTVRSLVECFAKAISIGLQHNVPLAKFVEAFVYTKFEPAGIVEGHDNIKTTTSILDFIFRDLAISYLKQKEFANVVTLEIEDESLKAALPPELVPRSVITQTQTQTQIQAQTETQTQPTAKNTGNICPNCHHATLIQTGPCVTCSTCAFNTGCG